jgi:beta-glucosidase
MHKILYTVVHSNAMNGLSSADRLQLVTPWWQTAFIALDVVLAALTVGSVFMLTKSIKLKKSQKEN